MAKKQTIDTAFSELSKMLADLETGSSTLTETGKKRKLGKVLSERIYKYLFNIPME
jgi:hypothetical protein